MKVQPYLISPGIKWHKLFGENIQIHIGEIFKCHFYWFFICTYINRFFSINSSHVLTEDTICREIKPDGKLHSKRLLTKTNHVPKWGERFFKAKFVCIVEESIVDPKERTIVTYTRNIGFNKIMVCRLIFKFFLYKCVDASLWRQSYYR